MRTIALTALTATLAFGASAQQRIAEATSHHGAILATKDGLVLPAGEFTVAEFVDAAAGYLCRNYVYDPSTLARAATFTLHRPLALDAIGAEEMLHALLAARDLAALPLDELRGVHQVVSLDARIAGVPMTTIVAPWRTPEDVLARSRMHDLVTTAVELHTIDALQLANMLRGHFAASGPWRPGLLTATAGGPRLLLLHGYRDQVAQVITTLRQVDRVVTPPVDRSLLQRVDALERELAELRERVRGQLAPR